MAVQKSRRWSPGRLARVATGTGEAEEIGTVRDDDTQCGSENVGLPSLWLNVFHSDLDLRLQLPSRMQIPAIKHRYVQKHTAQSSGSPSVLLCLPAVHMSSSHHCSRVHHIFQGITPSLYSTPRYLF